MQKQMEISATEAARRLGIRADYLTMLLRSGKLRGYKRDGVWRVDAEAVQQRLKEGEARND